MYVIYTNARYHRLCFPDHGNAVVCTSLISFSKYFAAQIIVEHQQENKLLTEMFLNLVLLYFICQTFDWFETLHEGSLFPRDDRLMSQKTVMRTEQLCFEP